jgi:hypothetical protein
MFGRSSAIALLVAASHNSSDDIKSSIVQFIRIIIDLSCCVNVVGDRDHQATPILAERSCMGDLFRYFPQGKSVFQAGVSSAIAEALRELRYGDTVSRSKK